MLEFCQHRNAMLGKKSHVDMRFSHVNMGIFSQHGILKKSHVNMEHLFLMKLATLQWNVQLSLSAHAATKSVSSRCWSWSCCRQSTSALCVRSRRHWYSSPQLYACQQLLLARLAAGKHVRLQLRPAPRCDTQLSRTSPCQMPRHRRG